MLTIMKPEDLKPRRRRTNEQTNKQTTKDKHGYTKRQRQLIQQAWRNLQIGKTACLKLHLTCAKGQISVSDIYDTLLLKKRCPLTKTRECTNCDPKPGRIDLFKAVRDLDLMNKSTQLELGMTIEPEEDSLNPFKMWSVR